MPSKPRGAAAKPGSRSTARSRPRSAADPAHPVLRGGEPAQKRELRAQGRKTMRRLLDAGAYVFERRGFDAARVDDIIKVAKTSHGTFYLYFANKEDLFKALAYDAMAEMERLGDELPAITPDADGEAALRAWIGQFVDSYASHGTVIRSWTQGEIADKDLGRRGRDLLLRLSGILGQRIDEAGTRNGHAEVAGVACLSMLERFNFFLQARQVSYDRDEAVAALTEATFCGFFLPSPVPLRRPQRAAGA